MVLYYLAWLGIIAFVSFILRFFGLTVGLTIENIVESIKLLATTGVVSAGIYLGIKGGITAFEYEVNYIFTSPVRNIKFLVSDLLFQLLLISGFALPSSTVVVWALTTPRTHQYIVETLTVTAIGILLAGVLSHLIGFARNWLGEALSKTLGWSLMFYVFLPVLNLAIESDVVNAVPTPVSIILGMVDGGVALLSGVVFITVLLVIYAAATTQLNLNSISLITVTTLADRPKKFMMYLRLPTALTRFFTFSSSDKTATMLYKLHLTRFVRDGSLWIVGFILAILTASNTVLPKLLGLRTFSEVAQLTLVALYTPLIPGLLSINWVLTEKPNTWFVKLSLQEMSEYAKSLMKAYITVSVLYSMALFAIVYSLGGERPYITQDLLLLASIAVYGSFLAIFTSSKTVGMSTFFSISSLIHVLVPLFGSIIFALPLLAARVLTPSPDLLPPQLTLLLSFYVLASSLALYILVGKASGDKLV